MTRRRDVSVWVERTQGGRTEMQRVKAEPFSEDEFVLDFEPGLHEEEWAFLTGERVRCAPRQLAPGKEVLVAVETVVYIPSLRVIADATRHTIEVHGMEPVVYSRRPSRNEPFVMWLSELSKTFPVRSNSPRPITGFADQTRRADGYHVVFSYDPRFSAQEAIAELIESADGFGFAWRVDERPQ
jgi:hypothetical protein